MEYEQPVTRVIERPVVEQTPPPVVTAEMLAEAELGDVFLVPPGLVVPWRKPGGFEVCDGQERQSRFYPEYCEAMGITTPTFTVPAPQRQVEHQVFIIKLK